MANAMLEKAEARYAAAEDAVMRTHEEIKSNEDFADVPSLSGSIEERDAQWAAMRVELAESRGEVEMLREVERQAELIKGRRDFLNGEQMPVPPVEQPQSVLDGTPQLRQGQPAHPMSGFLQWFNDEDVKGANERIAGGARAATYPHGKNVLAMGPEYDQFWLPDGNWIAGQRRDANLVTLTPQPPNTGAGTSPGTGQVEGTRPIIMQTTLPDPYTSVLDLITTLQVPTIDSQWWVEKNRAAPTATDLDVGENAPAHLVDFEGELHDVRIARYAVETRVSRRAMNNGIALQRIVSDRLPNLQRNVLDSEALNGDGGNNRFRGLLHWNAYSTDVPDLRNINWDIADTTSTSTSLNDSDEPREFPHRVREAITTVMRYGGSGASANAILVHFDIYDDVLNAADTTGQSTLTANWAVGVPPTIRGLPMLPTAHLGANVNSVIAIVADWSSMILLNNSAAEGGGLIVSPDNADNQSRGLVSFILDREYAFIVENPNAVCTITRT